MGIHVRMNYNQHLDISSTPYSVRVYPKSTSFCRDIPHEFYLHQVEPDRVAWSVLPQVTGKNHNGVETPLLEVHKWRVN